MGTVTVLLLIAAAFAGLSWLLHRPDPIVQADPMPHGFDGSLLTLRGVCKVCGTAAEHPLHRRTV